MTTVARRTILARTRVALLLATLAAAGSRASAQAQRQTRFALAASAPPRSAGAHSADDGHAAALASLRARIASSTDTAASARRRRPLVAGFLGVVPGLGHVYAGEPGRGAVVAGVWLASGLVAFSDANTTVTGAGAVVNLGTYVFSVADAALAAERYNRRHHP